MRNTAKSQEQSIERREGSSPELIAGGAMIELGGDELQAVVGGKPTVTITIKPDGTIIIVVK